VLDHARYVPRSDHRTEVLPAQGVVAQSSEKRIIDCSLVVEATTHLVGDQAPELDILRVEVQPVGTTVDWDIVGGMARSLTEAETAWCLGIVA
jgi:hypothetical protein